MTTAAGARTSCITNDTAGCTAAGAARHWNRSPRLTSIESGTRNLTDAAVHSQQRTRAPFLRSASAASQTTITKSVDCHR